MKAKDLPGKWWFWLIIIVIIWGIWRWSKRGFTVGYIPLLGLRLSQRGQLCTCPDGSAGFKNFTTGKCECTSNG